MRLDDFLDLRGSRSIWSSVSLLPRRRFDDRDRDVVSSSSSSATRFPRLRDRESPARDAGGELPSSILESSSPPVILVGAGNKEE